MKLIMCCAHKLLRYVWASPCSFVGLLLLPAGFLSGASVRVVAGTLEVAGGRIAAWISSLPRCLQFSAITFGHVILADNHASLAVHREHERVHVRQYEQWGMLFLPLYCGSSLIQHLRGRDPYFDNRFERQAREKDEMIRGEE
ncbi:MAG: hypothetical protein AB9919_14735 [Geobacteraceae bacterium]